MKLLVGLGNPGRKYLCTRHNVGFYVLDEIVRQHDARRKGEKFGGEVAEVDIAGQRTLLLWPQTFMNLSGTSVNRACGYYRLDEGDLLVICDDFNLPFAKLRFRAGGSSGGQKGLADIIQRLGTESFARLRVGVGPLPPGTDGAEFVLDKFTRDEGVDIDQTVKKAAEAAVLWLGKGIDCCMNQYN